jgi:hypothetical protein
MPARPIADIRADMEAAAKEHETEAARLRAAIAALDGKPAVSSPVVPMPPPVLPYWPPTEVQPLPAFPFSPLVAQGQTTLAITASGFTVTSAAGPAAS